MWTRKNSQGTKMFGRSLCCTVMFLSLASGLLCQEPPKPEETPPQNMPNGGVIRTESRVVLVDAVVTDKKGNYVRDLKQQDFKVYEDNKEQNVTSFSFGADPATQPNGQKRYVVLFFDNSSMEMPDQIQARAAAQKFIEGNASDDQLIAVADFGGVLNIRQNFTSNADLLKAAVTGTRAPNIQTNGTNSSVAVASNISPPGVTGPGGFPSFSSSESDYGARTMLLSVRSLAKSLRTIPGRKMLILFSAGFPLDSERISELTATIDACNKANVAVYPLDVRGLVSGGPVGMLRETKPGDSAHYRYTNNLRRRLNAAGASRDSRPHLILASSSMSAWPDPQKPGGGGGPAPGGGGGHPGGGTGGTGGTGGSGGTAGTGGGKGGTGSTGGTGTAGGGHGGAGGVNTGGGSTGGGYRGSTYSTYYNNPALQPRTILPPMMPSAATNQQVLEALAQGTGGFAIYNTNDLLGGLNRIARDQNEFYLLGYVPQSMPEGSCHTLKVKLNKGGMEVRSRSGYCNVHATNPLDGKPIEKQMEAEASGTAQGAIHGAMQAPYFYSAPNIARVDLNMEIPGESVQFDKDKGKYRADVNVLGIAYKPDGTVGARFNDRLNLELEKDEWKDFTKRPYHYQNQFDVAPGTYRLAVVLSSGSGDSFGKFETPLQVDPYDGKKFTVGGVVLSTNLQRVDQIPTDVDAALLEDRTPLIVMGMQVSPAASYTFKKSDNLVLYSELYAPQLTGDNPPKYAAGYRIFERTSNKQVFFSGAVGMSEFIQKGSPVVPFGLKIPLKDLAAGNYRLVLLAADGANNQAPQREVSFSLND